MLDRLIRGGTLVDGTGAPPPRAARPAADGARRRGLHGTDRAASDLYSVADFARLSAVSLVSAGVRIG